MKRTEEGSGIVFILFPVFGGVMPRQKYSLSMVWGGDFFAPFAKKYYPSIDRLDRWNGQRKDNFPLSEMGKCSII